MITFGASLEISLLCLQFTSSPVLTLFIVDIYLSVIYYLYGSLQSCLLTEAPYSDHLSTILLKMNVEAKSWT